MLNTAYNSNKFSLKKTHNFGNSSKSQTTCKAIASVNFNVLILFNAISCRRTGVPLNIKARKDSHGFDNIDDYFPDSGGVITCIHVISCFDVHLL